MVVCSSIFFISHLNLIDITPAPIFPRLKRAHDGMVRMMEVFGGVLVGRTVAARDMSTGQALAQMDPGTANL